MGLKRYYCGFANTVRPRLRTWFDRRPGSWLLEAEQALLNRKLPNLFGYHLLQIGKLDDRDLLENSRIPHQVVLDIEVPGRAGGMSGLPVATPEALPFAQDSLDVVLLPHVLEFERDPHQVLREVERIIIPEGYLLLTGFNPWSLWGLWQFVLAWRSALPWCGRFIHMPRIRDWLSLLGFDIVEVKTVFFRPPLRSEKFMGRLQWLERVGAKFWPFFGAAYIIVARKRVATLTPIRPQWRSRTSLVRPGAIEPTTRDLT